MWKSSPVRSGHRPWPNRRRTVLSAVMAAGIALLPMPATALLEPTSALIGRDLIELVRAQAERDIVIASLRFSNEEHQHLTQSEIETLDQTWRAEREARNQPLIATTLSNPLSTYLTRVQAQSIGLYTEIFIVNTKGLNVGQSNITSDYWQGDEAKFSKPIAQGSKGVFVDEAEFHEASRTHRAQVNFVIDDPNSGAFLGVATFEINLTELQRRLAP